MRVTGYKLNGYNATYEPCELDVKYGINANKKRVLEVEDIRSGITYFFELDENKGARHTRKKPGFGK